MPRPPVIVYKKGRCESSGQYQENSSVHEYLSLPISRALSGRRDPDVRQRAGGTQNLALCQLGLVLRSRFNEEPEGEVYPLIQT